MSRQGSCATEPTISATTWAQGAATASQLEVSAPQKLPFAALATPEKVHPSDAGGGDGQTPRSTPRRGEAQTVQSVTAGPAPSSEDRTPMGTPESTFKAKPTSTARTHARALTFTLTHRHAQSRAHVFTRAHARTEARMAPWLPPAPQAGTGPLLPAGTSVADEVPPGPLRFLQPGPRAPSTADARLLRAANAPAGLPSAREGKAGLRPAAQGCPELPQTPTRRHGWDAAEGGGQGPGGQATREKPASRLPPAAPVPPPGTSPYQRHQRCQA